MYMKLRNIISAIIIASSACLVSCDKMVEKGMQAMMESVSNHDYQDSEKWGKVVAVDIPTVGFNEIDLSGAVRLEYKQDSIYSYKAETLLPRNGRVTEIVTRGRNNEYVRQGGNRGSSGSQKAANSRLYTVRKGESLGSIARKHHTTTAKLRSLNKLKSDRIHPGQKLRLP